MTRHLIFSICLKQVTCVGCLVGWCLFMMVKGGGMGRVSHWGAKCGGWGWGVEVRTYKRAIDYFYFPACLCSGVINPHFPCSPHFHLSLYMNSCIYIYIYYTYILLSAHVLTPTQINPDTKQDKRMSGSQIINQLEMVHIWCSWYW